MWDLLDAERARRLLPFVARYQQVREAEGRARVDGDWLRALPFRDLSGERPVEWQLRAQSYQALLRRAIPSRPSRILDVGAGNGWLASRLAQRGHTVAAVDLSLDAGDGLGAHVHHVGRFLRVRASMERLPFVASSVDVVVLNGSLHYSSDVAAVLREATRVLVPTGRVVVMDSPLYRRADSGRQMLAERDADFERRYGFGGNEHGGEGFFTRQRYAELGRQVGIRWRLRWPWRGLRRLVAPYREQLVGRREPARFPLVLGRLRGSRTRARRAGPGRMCRAARSPLSRPVPR